MQFSQLLFLVLGSASLSSCASLREDTPHYSCDDSMNFDFSGEVPAVMCSSTCTLNAPTWSAGSVYKRSAELSEFGLMVKIQYDESGISCSVVDSKSDEELMENFREESDICDSYPVTPQTPPSGPHDSASFGTGPSVTYSGNTTPSGDSVTYDHASDVPGGSNGITTEIPSGTGSPVIDSGNTTPSGDSVTYDHASDIPGGSNGITTEIPSATEETTNQGCVNIGENDNGEQEETTVPKVPTTTTPAPRMVCPSEWSQFGNSCYHISSVIGSWDSGKEYCKSIGGSYVTISSSGEQNYIKSMLRGNTWIGYNDWDDVGTFVWSSGENSSFTAFVDGEPNGGTANPFCIEMAKDDDYLWNDKGCSRHNYYACETGLVVET